MHSQPSEVHLVLEEAEKAPVLELVLEPVPALISFLAPLQMPTPI
eukprot:SAG11_NODE_22167_length_411_cov_0.570513_2_plen_45_part_00